MENKITVSESTSCPCFLPRAIRGGKPGLIKSGEQTIFKWLFTFFVKGKDNFMEKNPCTVQFLFLLILGHGGFFPKIKTNQVYKSKGEEVEGKITTLSIISLV